MIFSLFSKVAFEVSCPVALIESYCFQSDFYANYDLLIDRKVEDVNAIGARIPKKQLNACKRIVNSARSMSIFEYHKHGLDEFVNLGDKTIAKFVREDLVVVIGRLMVIEGIGLSRATKVLHTVYPGIIPMIDSMLKKVYIQTKPGERWTEDDLVQIFIAYYKNLNEQPTKQNLTEVYNSVSKNLRGLTKVRVFDILWWSYLKAENLKEKHDIKWVTIQSAKSQNS